MCFTSRLPTEAGWNLANRATLMSGQLDWYSAHQVCLYNHILYVPQNMHTLCCAFLGFVYIIILCGLFWYNMNSQSFSSLAMARWYDESNAIKKCMGKMSQLKTKHNQSQTVCLILGMFCTFTPFVTYRNILTQLHISHWGRDKMAAISQTIFQAHFVECRC